jgi:GNAT superfamily N-acetyltransferase
MQNRLAAIMEFRIEEFKPKEVSDEFWEKYFTYLDTYSKFNNPDDPLPDRVSVMKRLKSDRPHYLINNFLVVSPKSKIIGWGGFRTVLDTSPEYDMNRHICSIGISVLPDYWRKGIGSSLLRKLVTEAQIHEKTILQIQATHDSGRSFLKKYGATLSLEGSVNRLELDDADWDMMQSWVDEGKKRNKGAILESFIECPEEILDEFTEMLTETTNMAPHGDIESRTYIDGALRREHEEHSKKLGNIHYTLITREKSGRITGMTEIYYNPGYKDRIQQNLTGVLQEFRGKGYGKWLKAHMILHIRDTYPEVRRIITGNASVNAPMLSINKRMGFKEHKSAEIYKFKTEELAKKLGLDT